MNKINKIKQIKKFKKSLKKKTEKKFLIHDEKKKKHDKNSKKNGKFELSAHSPSSPLSRVEALSNSSAFG